ncbi:hypothetical protein TREMEDRAFT_33211, partial [Tremella mesenterica DSM 1558]|uniref:uncharacterized protein n=1 Tax=Tremella mesenterica (strain ATCC 24925 / CBS 8224 / DSM 1558 / NBRC 9311 / NRRL Y-6157 / RJB 2259-6 / UBC 559-6) TaxID=578456 RepID=UPI0003F48F5F
VVAAPTQIHPSERTLYLEALLEDLRPVEAAVWTQWPDDLYLSCLTAVKSLGRNPVGSEIMYTPENLQTILYHTSLPGPPRKSLLAPVVRSPTSPTALEALRILANLLVLHAEGRENFSRADGALIVAKALAGRAWDGELEVEFDSPDRLFLLGRIGFLITLDRKEAVETMVVKEDLVSSLVYHLTSVPPQQSNFAALSELLKLANNVIRFFPRRTTSEHDPWDTLCLLHEIPFNDLSPPLSHTIHVLLSIPFSSTLLNKWQSIPNPPPATSPSGTTVRSLFNKFSSMSSNTVYTIANPRKSSSDSTSSASSSTQGKVRSPAPSPTHVRRERVTLLPPMKTDETALGRRLMKILTTFVNSWLPEGKAPDGELPKGLILDEQLPPLLLLIARATDGSSPTKTYFRDTLLPTSLDRSPEAGPLEKRHSVLGAILRLMQSTLNPQCRDTAGEMMWSICDSNASELCAEIGYGNAAGLLFRKGITEPPPGRITPLPEPTKLNVETKPFFKTTSISPKKPGSPSKRAVQEERNPITSLRRDDDTSLDDMTQEEKESEAERLFVLFERMERNPVISMKSGDEQKGVKDVMREKMQSGELEVKEREEEEADRRRLEEEEKIDEEDARKEMEAYRQRMKR